MTGKDELVHAWATYLHAIVAHPLALSSWPPPKEPEQPCETCILHAQALLNLYSRHMHWLDRIDPITEVKQ